jgi:hypothetical protein
METNTILDALTKFICIESLKSDSVTSAVMIQIAHLMTN